MLKSTVFEGAALSLMVVLSSSLSIGFAVGKGPFLKSFRDGRGDVIVGFISAVFGAAGEGVVVLDSVSESDGATSVFFLVPLHRVLC